MPRHGVRTPRPRPRRPALADAAANAFGLAVSPLYEDYALGLRSLARLAALEFEAAVFGQGKPIVGGASGRFRRKWGTG